MFKAGDQADVRNYRPICKLSTIPKLFEEIVTDKLMSYLTNVICDEQHGFVPQRSTITNLAVYHCAVSAALDVGLQVDTIYTDFSKAFDSVDHSILLHKLTAYGFNGPFLSWIRSYLMNRVQVIRVGNQFSTPVAVGSGVPQGSHLGPLLFILFINDLKGVFRNCRFLMYADDLKIFRTIGSGHDAVLLQEDLSRFERWCTANRMVLNTAKCVLMRAHRSVQGIMSSYTLCNAPLIEVDDVTDLGVKISSGLDFRKHYQNLTSRAMKTLGFIARFAKHFKRQKSWKLLYVALVRPQLEYASVIWNPKHKHYVSLIERVQHKFLRLALRALGNPMHFSDHDYGPALQSMGIATLSVRRLTADLIFLHKIIHGRVNCPELVSALKFRAPERQLRPRPLFECKEPGYRNYTADPLNRAMGEANINLTDIDLFAVSLDTLRLLLNCRSSVRMSQT